MSNKPRAPFSTPLIIVLATALAPSAARSQVGHDPEHSPYRDLRASHQVMVSGGYLAGSGGLVGAGPKQGPLGGVRYYLSLSGSLEFRIGAQGARLDRALDSTSILSQSVLIADAGFTLRITGPKTWHGWMPYAGGSMGLAAGSTVAQDSAFGRPFQFGPHVGIRRYGAGRLSLFIEGWDPIWRLHYPLSWQSGATQRVNVSREWVHNPTLMVGFGFTLRN